MRQIILNLIAISLCLSIQAQMEDYGYKREITNIEGRWNKIIIPDDMFGKTNSLLEDIRIYSISEQDTVESPYILKIDKTKKSFRDDIQFELLNQSKKGNEFYYTYKILNEKTINRILLNFDDKNFDWKVNLEGSNDQEEWFTILEQYRILSINNNNTEFKYTDLVFPNSQYKFYRLSILAPEQPTLKQASIYEYIVDEGKRLDKKVMEQQILNDNGKEQSEVLLNLGQPVPVSYLEIPIQSDIDYYRNVTIYVAKDSTQTQDGWEYHYAQAGSQIISSLNENIITFSSKITRRIKIIINNLDDAPLDIGNCIVKGYEYSLTARLHSSDRHEIVYGNTYAGAPSYDLSHFKSTIPENMNVSSLGQEIQIEKKQDGYNGLNTRKVWVYLMILVIAGLLVWYTFKMMRNNDY